MSLWWLDTRGHGTFNLVVNFGRENINRHSTVLANICEISQPEGQPLDFPFMGAASMLIRNIVPRDDGQVHLRVEIDWGSDLNYRIRFAIF